MAAITNPGTKATEFSGQHKVLSLYNLALTSASDAITLSEADNSIGTIQNVIVSANGGVDAAFQTVSASFSGLVVTIASQEQDGTGSTEWTGTTCNLLVVGY
jgi:hypothetical protein